MHLPDSLIEMDDCDLVVLQLLNDFSYAWESLQPDAS